MFHEAFLKKWGGHSCEVPGCNDVLVLDGNMKNARQVCSCRDIGELQYAGMEGTVVVGCQNTPGKGSRYCHIHNGFARQFQDDNIEDTINESKTAHNSDELLVVKILNEKSTKKTKMYEVLWSDGQKSWLRNVHLPKKVEEIVQAQKDYTLQLSNVVEFGQRRRELQVLPEKRRENDGFPVGQSIVSSSGFAIENVDDGLVQDSSGKKRQLEF
ncbi:uncharacterized protein LOC114970138 isoform X3 [Acropora millepora]|uniref:uncharacterized protein LOC114970138 isoform X3 n=1 Tax=Acropora millepora TaxID=45264 RepID=UPI001CF53DF6|nr:uncharacterized protein LOC114970138 isoform X3 [Acropora millepora]